jgi:flagellar protein FlgJ
MAGEVGLPPVLPPLSTASIDFGGTLGQSKKPALQNAVREMETLFLSLLLKEMRQSQDSEEGGLFAGDTADVYGGLFDLYMGQHLANAGGIGLSTVWLKQIEQSQQSERIRDESPPDRAGHADPGLPQTPSP